MTITEIFDQPVTAHWHQVKIPHKIAYEFTLGEDDEYRYRVYFVPEGDDSIPGWDQGWRIWEVEFELLGQDNSFGITGTGNAIQVFQTVMKIMQDFVKSQKNPVAGISFVAWEGSRVKLYHNLIKMFPRFAGAEFAQAYQAGSTPNSSRFFIWNLAWQQLCDQVSKDLELKKQNPPYWQSAVYWSNRLRDLAEAS